MIGGNPKNFGCVTKLKTKGRLLMKKTYKLFSLFLALTMLCTVFAMPVSAAAYSTNDSSFATSDHYDNRVECEGTVDIWFRSFDYKSYCKNISAPEDIYDLSAQFVIIYSDDSYDITYARNNPNIGHGRRDYAQGYATMDSQKTATGFDASFYVSFQGELLWEGYVYPSFTLGINA